MSGNSIRTKLPKALDYSQYIARKRTVGISSNVFDLQNTPNSKLDLAYIYSNGYRYQYLAFKAEQAGQGLTGVTSCGSTTDFGTVIQLVFDQDGLPTGETVEIERDPTVVTFAYVGNAVVPQAPPNNIPTNGLFPPSKAQSIPTKIGC